MAHKQAIRVCMFESPCFCAAAFVGFSVVYVSRGTLPQKRGKGLLGDLDKHQLEKEAAHTILGVTSMSILSRDPSL